MRTLNVILCIICISLRIGIYAQTTPTTNEIDYVSNFTPTSFTDVKKNTLLYYKQDIDSLNYNFNKKFKKTKKEADKWVFSNNMLAQFFNNEINSFAVSMKDLSLEENIVSVSTESKTLTIGRNIILPNNKNRPDKDLRKISQVISLSVSSGIDKNFSKVYAKNNKTNEYDFASEININLKYVHLLNNWITIDTIQKNTVKSYRDTVIKDQIEEEIKDDKELSASDSKDSEKVLKKYYEFYKKISEKEIKNIKENKLFNSYTLWWIGGSLDIPFTGKDINVKSTKTVGNFETIRYDRWRLDGFLNMLHFCNNLASGTTFNFRFSASVFNNNNFLADNSSAITFQTISDSNSSQQVIASEDLVFIGDYKKFVTTVIKLEGSSLFLKNTIGVSGGIEKNIGYYDAFNWKLGIPVSLKDKDKKPTLNFELQWREVNKIHVIGLSAGFIFGKFVR